MTTEADVAPRTVIVWDLPTRLVHWLIAILFAFSWWSGEEKEMQWHRWSGYAVLFLLTLRIYWGLFGSQTARFSSFVRGPRDVLIHLRTLGARTPAETLGHNPLGALSVVALLGTLAAQVTFGLFAVDVDGLESGPLSDRVDFDTGRLFAEWHETSFTVLQVLVALHLAAVAFYLVYKRANLIGPMITGRTRRADLAEPARAPAWRLILGLLIAAGVTWAVAKGLRF